MTPTLVWTPQARDDLLDIYLTVSLDSQQSAEKLLSAFLDQIEVLKNLPRMGRRRPEIAPSARMLVKGMYLILYETLPDTDDAPISRVQIVRVVHGQRDLSRAW